MRVLLVSKFLHHVGGVETYLRWQAQALDRAGCTVGVLGMEPPAGESMMTFPGHDIWTTPTRDYRGGMMDRVRGAATSVWSPKAGQIMQEALRVFRPDVVHMHGTCFQLTPAVVQEAHRYGSPLVLTAHEYKLVCANQRLFDDTRRSICMDCVGVTPATKMVAPVRRRCMKKSLAVSAIGAIEGPVADRTWRQADPLVLTPSCFMRDLLVKDGWDPNRVDYLDLAWRPESVRARREPGVRDGVVFLGRLAAEKGADLLLDVWERVAPNHPDLHLRYIGDGAEHDSLEADVARRGLPRVEFLGRLERHEIDHELARAVLTVHPARWHENSPFTVRESLMAGVPAVVSAVGGMQEMVGPDTGATVPPDDVDAWVAAVEAMLARPVDEARMLTAVEQRAMTDEAHLSALMRHYETELARRGR